MEEKQSLLTKPEEELPITDKQYQSTTKAKKRKKPSKAKVLTKKKQSDNANLTGMSKQLEKQSNQLVKIEKLLQPLQKSFNKIDRQSTTVKQAILHGNSITERNRSSEKNNNKPLKKSKKERKG